MQVVERDDLPAGECYSLILFGIVGMMMMAKATDLLVIFIAVFSAAVSTDYYGLAIVGVLTSVISVCFYLRVVVMMYMAECEAAPVPAPVTGVGLAALAVATVAISYLGILPPAFIDLAAASIATIF